MPSNDEVFRCIGDNFYIWEVVYCKHKVFARVVLCCDVHFDSLVYSGADHFRPMYSRREICCGVKREKKSCQGNAGFLI